VLPGGVGLPLNPHRTPQDIDILIRNAISSPMRSPSPAWVITIAWQRGGIASASGPDLINRQRHDAFPFRSWEAEPEHWVVCHQAISGGGIEDRAQCAHHQPQGAR
jgi:hypothetical protein